MGDVEILNDVQEICNVVAWNIKHQKEQYLTETVINKIKRKKNLLLSTFMLWVCGFLLCSVVVIPGISMFSW